MRCSTACINYEPNENTIRTQQANISELNKIHPINLPQKKPEGDEKSVSAGKLFQKLTTC